MKRFLPWLATAFFLISLAACDVSGNILSPADKDQLYSADYRLLSGSASSAGESRTGKTDAQPSFTDGSSLKPGESFSVFCKAQAADSSVNAVTVSLIGADSVIASVLFLRSGSAAPSSLGSMASRELPAVLDASLPVSLPDGLKPGPYAIKTGFYDKNALVFEKSLHIFVLSSAPSVESIQACPASASPGATVLLQAQIGFPDDGRPYLVWRYGSTVIGAGLLSEGLGQILWKCPEKEGVYGLKLFVYPFPPAAGQEFAFDSPVMGSAKVVTSLQPADLTDPFRDAQDFYSLMRFSGNFEDSGYREKSAKPSFSGQARAAVLGVNYGYQFDSERVLSFNDYLLPIKDGRLGAFSLMGRFMAPKKAAGVLFRSESNEPGFGLSLSLDEDGQYLLVLSNRNNKAVSASGIFADGKVHDLVVSLTPTEKGLSLQWFLDYKAQARDDLALSFSGLPSSGRAFFGGPGAVQAVYDDFGVYASVRGADSSAFARVYQTLAAKTYRESLMLATGFEGSDLPEGMTAAGNATLDSGALFLGERSNLAIPLACAKGDNIQIDMQFRSGSGKDYALTLGPNGSPAVRLRPDGLIQWIDGSGKPAIKAESMNGLSPAIKLEISQNACSLVSGARRVELFALGDKFSSITLTLEAQSRLSVESFMARRLSDIELLADRGKAAGRAAALSFGKF
jgi:hypothetical protein